MTARLSSVYIKNQHTDISGFLFLAEGFKPEVDMQTLPSSYLMEMAKQLAFLSAFLGGFAATFLATLLVAGSEKKIADWSIGSAAVSASGFVVSVIASVMITVVLHPDVPGNVAAGVSVNGARIISALSFGLGVYALLLSVGLCGWVRSRRLGMITSIAAGVGILLVSWAFIGF